MVRLEDVSYSVGDRNILTGFSYNFQPGERLGIVGPNGSGKSTLLDLIAGVQPALLCKLGCCPWCCAASCCS